MQAFSAADGTFVLSGLLSGAVELEVVAIGGSPLAPQHVVRTQAMIGGPGAPAVQLRLPIVSAPADAAPWPAGTVAVVLPDADGDPQAPPLPLDGEGGVRFRLSAGAGPLPTRAWICTNRPIVRAVRRAVARSPQLPTRELTGTEQVAAGDRDRVWRTMPVVDGAIEWCDLPAGRHRFELRGGADPCGGSGLFLPTIVIVEVPIEGTVEVEVPLTEGARLLVRSTLPEPWTTEALRADGAVEPVSWIAESRHFAMPVICGPALGWEIAADRALPPGPWRLRFTRPGRAAVERPILLEAGATTVVLAPDECG